MFDKNSHHLKGHRLAESLQVLHCLRKPQSRDLFFLSVMLLAKSLTSAEGPGAVSLQGKSESAQCTRLWSSQGCLWSCRGLCQLRTGACSHYLGRSPFRLRSRTKGVICLRRLQQWVISWQGSKHYIRMSIKSLYGHWSHNHKRVLYWYSLWFQKMFSNMESSSINNTFNAFIKVIPTHLASSTQERSSTEPPSTTQWEIQGQPAFQLLVNSRASAEDRTQVKSLSEKWLN